MKTNLLSFVLILAVLTGYSQSKFTEFVGPNKYLSVKETRMHPGQTTINQGGIIGEKMLDFTPIGTTWYDLQTTNYGNVMKRMYAYPDGTIGSTWCGAGEELVYERGAGYNYFDGSSWGEPNLHVGPEDRMGSPCYAPWGPEGEIIAVYRYIPDANDFSIYFYKREIKGEGDWTEVELAPPTGFALVWHSMITSGENHEHIHLLAETYSYDLPPLPYQGQENALLYYRSSDGAENWDIEEHIIEGLGSEYFDDINDLSHDWANPVGDTIAFSYGFDVFGGRVFRSYDNGDNWEIIPVFNSPIPGVDPPLTTDYFIPCGVGSSACALDSEGNVHVAFPRNSTQFADPDNYYRPYTDGVIYWNESMEPLDTTTISTYTLDYLEEGGYLVGWVIGYEDFEILTDQPTYGNSACAFPQFSIDADDNLFLVYNSIAPGYDNGPGTFTYRHIIVNRSFDGGATWLGQVDINTDPLFLISECAFPMMPPVIMDDIHITYQRDGEQGIAQWQEDHPEVENEILYTQYDKYIFTDVPENKSARAFEVSECYPNPASEILAFSVNLSRNTTIQYSIANITGQVVKELTTLEMKAGQNPVKLDVSDLLAGIYFCTVSDGLNHVTKKFVVK